MEPTSDESFIPEMKKKVDELKTIADGCPQLEAVSSLFANIVRELEMTDKRRSKNPFVYMRKDGINIGTYFAVISKWNNLMNFCQQTFETPDEEKITKTILAKMDKKTKFQSNEEAKDFTLLILVDIHNFYLTNEESKIGAKLTHLAFEILSELNKADIHKEEEK